MGDAQLLTFANGDTKMPYKSKKDFTDYMRGYQRRNVDDKVEDNRNRKEFEKRGLVHKGDGKEIDHIVPRSKGGSNDDDNLRVVKAKTNKLKSNKEEEVSKKYKRKKNKEFSKAVRKAAKNK